MELNEQTLEQILTRQREEYQRYVEDVRGDFKQDLEATRRHMGVLVEGLEHKVQLIAEGHELLREEMKLEFAEVKTETEAIRLELEMIRSELSIIRRDLKEKSGRDELAVLEARVAKLEQAVRRR